MRIAALLLIAVSAVALAQAPKKDGGLTPAEAQAGQRAALEYELLQMCRAASPNHHGIKVVERRAGKGYALLCQHSFYNEFSLDYGRLNPAFQEWMTPGRLQRLREAKVTRVGITGTGEYATGSYFEIR
jgi:hypothetical protein